MLLENMKMALSSLRANKLRSILTMLGIIIGIGSVISIVSIGDTMRKMFSDLYKNVGVTQASIMLNPYMDQEEFRDSDWFTMDDLEKVKEVFGDRLDYIDNMSSGSLDIKNGLNRLKTNVEGVDTAYQKLQPVQILNGRYISKTDVAERRAVIMISESTALKLYGTVNVSGKHFRSNILGENREFSIIGVYRKDISPIQKLLMGSDDKNGEGIVPWTLLTPQSSTFFVIRYYGKDHAGFRYGENQRNRYQKGFGSKHRRYFGTVLNGIRSVIRPGRLDWGIAGHGTGFLRSYRLRFIRSDSSGDYPDCGTFLRNSGYLLRYLSGQ